MIETGCSESGPAVQIGPHIACATSHAVYPAGIAERCTLHAKECKGVIAEREAIPVAAGCLPPILRDAGGIFAATDLIDDAIIFADVCHIVTRTLSICEGHGTVGRRWRG